MTYRVVIKGRELKQGIQFKVRENNEIKLYKFDFNNYFYIKDYDYDEIGHLIRHHVLDTRTITTADGEEYRKIILNNNLSRHTVRKIIENLQIQTFEADINAEKRFLVQNQQLKLNQKDLRCCFFDIETDDRNPLVTDYSGVVQANSCILSYAIKDEDDNIIYKYNKARNIEGFTDKDLFLNEKELLYEMFNDLKQYDLVHAYNGWRFDFPFVKQRANIHGLLDEYEELMQQHIDYMVLYKKYTYGSYKSYSLQAVSQREFIDYTGSSDEEKAEVSKIDWREKTGLKSIFELYCKRADVLEEYNIQDVNLMLMIERKMKFNMLSSVVADICHCYYEDTLFNSHSFDYAMLNEYYNRKLIAPSKPSFDEKEERKNIKPGGGYTYCFKPGFHKELLCYDYKSFYPTSSITFNISPDTFQFTFEPAKEELLEIFSIEEYSYMMQVINAKQNFINKKGELNSGRYNKFVNDLGNKYNMEDLMWKFTKLYKAKEAQKIAKEKNLVFTPADLNNDVNGWHLHPHRFFNREEGIFPKICRESITKRDEVKYQLKQIEKEKGKNSSEYHQKDIYQQGLKLLGNAGFGTFGFRSFRFFMYDIVDTITTSCRWIMKQTILHAEQNNCVVVAGDTDSSYFSSTRKVNTVELDYIFYKFYDSLLSIFNTFAQIKHKNPKTNEIEIKNHFTVFEYEKTFDSCIFVAKKRYYYKQTLGNNEIVYLTQGGAYKKTDTITFAADLQRELCKDILDEVYDKNIWYKKIKEAKEIVYSSKLNLSHIETTKAISKDIDEYGLAVVDGDSGKQKLRKSDGKPMTSPIPAHILIAKYFKKIGKEVEVGDKISFVIYDKSGKIIPLDIENFNMLSDLKEEGKDITEHIKKIDYIVELINELPEKKIENFDYNKLYDVDYYWDRVTSVLVEIFATIDKENCFTFYKDLWNMTEKQITRELESLNLEE